ncbi:MAG: MarR family transcriptional regulator [Rhizobiales bacterium]|nr:MarR family transcriptional regulator [Hyphomicrobiales bacterium]
MIEPPLGFMLVDAARLYRARIDQAFEQAGLGITAGEARTLAHVNINPGLRQTALAVRMNVEPMTLVGFLDRLEAQGLVVRDTDPTDRRAKIIRLTESAAPLLERVNAAAAIAREEALKGLGEAERDAFRTALTLIRKNLCQTTKADD